MKYVNATSKRFWKHIKDFGETKKSLESKKDSIDSGKIGVVLIDGTDALVK